MLLSSLMFLLLSQPQQPVMQAEIQAVDLAAGWVEVSIPPGAMLTPNTELILAAEMRPLGRFRVTRQDADGATFARKQPIGNLATGRLHAWLVWPNLADRLRDKWPVAADLVGAIERIGPGARSVWISAGAASGVQPGMAWWERIGGQPVVRFDVLSIERDACFCSVVRLAANAAVRRGDCVTLWPSPGQRRTGAATSAVSYVEHSPDRKIVWVAAPRGVATPAEPHLDFFHAGQYVGHGVVESMDDLFWYARLTESGRASGGDRREQTPPVAVGDVAVIRTQADIVARRFVARVFRVSPEGAIINAGAADGIGPGETVSLYRGGAKVGDMRIGRIQGSYSVMEPLGQPETPATRPDARQPASDHIPASRPTTAPAVVPAVGDVVRFGNPPEPPLSLAEIDSVVDGTLFSARALTQADIPALKPLLVRTNDQSGGVALVLESDGGRLCGLVLEDSLTTPLRPGAVVQQPSPAEAAEPP